MECLDPPLHKDVFEVVLKTLLATEGDDNEVGRAMRYAASSGGKRLRPALCFAGYQLGAHVAAAAENRHDGVALRSRAAAQDSQSAEAGSGSGTGTGTGTGSDDRLQAMTAAIAVELVHTASLTLDDLPSMDNAQTRRNEPCTHVKFGDATAIMASLKLFMRAIALAMQCDGNGRIAHELLRAADAMVRGQGMDLRAPAAAGGTQAHKDDASSLAEAAASAVAAWTCEDVRRVHDGKTAALIEAAVVAGVMLAHPDVNVETLQAARVFGRSLGEAYQIADDIVDATQSEATAGKPCGRDVELSRPNMAVVKGVDGAAELARELCRKAKSAVEPLPGNASLLRLADFVDAMVLGMVPDAVARAQSVLTDPM